MDIKNIHEQDSIQKEITKSLEIDKRILPLYGKGGLN
jgi:hypothetical protein